MARRPTREELLRVPGCGRLNISWGRGYSVENCALRVLREYAARDAWLALGANPEEDDIVIVGDIGTIILAGERLDFIPAPSATDKAAGVANAAWESFRRIVNGEPSLAAAEVIKARLLTCAACVHYLEQEKRCGACRCYTEAKARLAAAHCPLGYWKK